MRKPLKIALGILGGSLGLLVIGILSLAVWPWKKVSTAERVASMPHQGLPLAKPATIYWNEEQVPYISAQSDSDAAFLFGMVHAHLRLGQMEIIRRIAYGRLSESFGPWAVRYDQMLRAFHFPRLAESAEKKLPPDTKAWVTYYVDGVNFYIANAKKLPQEFFYFDLDPKEKWTTKDIMVISRLLASDFNWGEMLAYYRLSTLKGFDKYWNELLGFTDDPQVRIGELLNHVTDSGSNAFVLGGSLTQAKKPILGGDPHLGISLPNFWVLVGLHSPGFNTVGLTIPCIPLVTIGRNPHIAWGGTNMHAWSSDLVDVTQENPDEWKVRDEKIGVRFWKDHTLHVRESRWGPVLNDIPLLKNNDQRKKLALRWVGSDASDELSALLKVNQAENWGQFLNAFDTYSVVGIFYTYADEKGNIGFVPAAKLPRRSGDARMVYEPATDPERWQNIRDIHKKWAIFNPPGDLVVSANNVLTKGAEYAAPFNTNSYRFDRITQLIKTKKKWYWPELLSVQKDTYSAGAQTLATMAVERILAAGFSPSWAPKLRTWNGFYETDSEPALLFSLLMYHLVKEHFQKTVDSRVLQSMLSSSDLVRYLTHLLDRETISKSTWKSVVRRVGRDFKKFKTYGDYHRLSLAYPLGMIPWLGRKFVFRQMPWPGAGDTVLKANFSLSNQRRHVKFGAQSRYVFDFSDKNGNYFMLLGGQDGWFGSENFDDMVDHWLHDEWVQIPLEVSRVEAMFPYRVDFVPASHGS